jgi:hypothetical protein
VLFGQIDGAWTVDSGRRSNMSTWCYSQVASNEQKILRKQMAVPLRIAARPLRGPGAELTAKKEQPNQPGPRVPRIPDLKKSRNGYKRYRLNTAISMRIRFGRPLIETAIDRQLPLASRILSHGHQFIGHAFVVVDLPSHDHHCRSYDEERNWTQRRSSMASSWGDEVFCTR